MSQVRLTVVKQVKEEDEVVSTFQFSSVQSLSRVRLFATP